MENGKPIIETESTRSVLFLTNTKLQSDYIFFFNYFSVRSVLLYEEKKAVQQELQDESSFFGLCSGSGRQENDSVDSNRKMKQSVPTC